jgi:3-isopropylmalate dehydrogenase
MEYNISVIEGDGIGLEITKQAVKVLGAIGEIYNHKFNFEYLLAGGASIDEYGIPLTEEVLNKAKNSDSVLLGAVGGPKWEYLEGGLRPERALLGLREGLGLYANLRPVVMYEALREASPIKDSFLGEKLLDILIVRELTGGIYFGERGRSEDGLTAYDTESYSVNEIERVVKTAFDCALIRNKKVTLVDKSNVLESSRLWREVFDRIHEDYKEVQVEYMYVDNAAMQLIKNPSQFDVIVTSNMFGDILSDEASQITGSIGMLASASLGKTKCGMYEPIHGSAPDIAGENKANPIATILSAAMMLRYSFDLEKEAKAIESVINEIIKEYRTPDIFVNGTTKVDTDKMGDLIVNGLYNLKK